MQDVPVSIQAFGTEKLEQMNVSSFDDYAKLIPSLSFQSEGGPSFEHTYMRGVVSGGDGNHSGSQPSVGMYLDEQPVTTIDGNLNMHIYDIQRIEALSGPQGTLYGASSESGTIRIITNKPDPKAFAAGYDLEGNTVDHGGQGYKFEGFVNIPLIRHRGRAPRRLGREGRGIHRQRARDGVFRYQRHHRRQRGTGQEECQRHRDEGRPRGPESGPERQLDDPAAVHGTGAPTPTATSPTTRRSARWRR